MAQDTPWIDATAVPITEEQYRDSFSRMFQPPETRERDFLGQQQEIYTNMVSGLLAEFKESDFWKCILRELRNRHAAYPASYGLLAHSQQLDKVVGKPWDSLILKSYRMNVLNNKNWPNPPAVGWTMQDNWFERITDTIRTTIVVRYLDGVEMAKVAVEEAAADTDTTLLCDYEARENGYYALHITARPQLTFSRKSTNRVRRELPVEIQVCTQVQEVLRALTHKFYEGNRRRAEESPKNWPWKYREDQFAPNYLGHILHYADGVIMNIRHQQEGT